ncbi:molecular chaperone TorD family protein [Ferrimonas balearica]|uniref:TorD/DmsD family molecular chaperone n=1 Tax=Ferrimonas balearica TaxID=44012 RepID=UPI001C963821|nr:molecular chaperone TorD family protein [Ferrimonas balearica]MBY6108161.1 molecular chaperone TorD family protein [Ferrimonas balearica]
MLAKSQLEGLEAGAHLFHSVFMKAPERHTVNQLKDRILISAWPEIGGAGERTETGLALLLQFVEQWQASDMQLVALKLDFSRLFIGPGQPLAPPWGSVYLEASSLLNGESTLAFTDFLRQNQIQVAQQSNEPLDHIGIQFAVLAYLLGQLAEQPGSDMAFNRGKTLLSDFMLPWADRCLELAECQANTQYYKGFVVLARQYLLHLRRLFGVGDTAVPLFH